MTLVDRIDALTRWDPEAYLPLQLEERTVGHVAKDAAARFQAHPQVFVWEAERVTFRSELDDPAKRSAALAPVLAAWAHDDWILPPRGEGYPVVERWGDEPVFVVDRAGAARLGTPGFGVHLDGWSLIAGVPTFWIGHRAENKPTWPAHLDHLVAGGQPLGLTLHENLLKEAEEEAGLPAPFLSDIEPRGALRYRVAYEGGLRNDTIVTYDLELPIAFEPENQDGELSRFERVPLPALVHLLRGEARFKPNVALVLLDLIEAKGWLDDDPEVDAVRARLAPLRVSWGQAAVGGRR